MAVEQLWTLLDDDGAVEAVGAVEATALSGSWGLVMVVASLSVRSACAHET